MISKSVSGAYDPSELEWEQCIAVVKNSSSHVVQQDNESSLQLLQLMIDKGGKLKGSARLSELIGQVSKCYYPLLIYLFASILGHLFIMQQLFNLLQIY
jgi:hypothetical protein